MSEEGVDQLRPVLDLLEPVLHHHDQLIATACGRSTETTGQVARTPTQPPNPARPLARHRDLRGVATAAPTTGSRRTQGLTGLVLDAQPRTLLGRYRFPAGHVSFRHVTTSSSSRSTARCAGTCGENPIRCKKIRHPSQGVPGTKQPRDQIATQASVQRRSSANPWAGWTLLQRLRQPRLAQLIQPAGRPRPAPSTPMPCGRRHASGVATRTPRWSTPAARGRSERSARPGRTVPPPVAASPRVGPCPVRAGHRHPRILIGPG